MKLSRHAQAQLEESIVALFEGFPSLCGFAVLDRPATRGGSEALRPGLFLTDIGLFPQPGLDDVKQIHEGIRDTLVDLIEERPEAHRLLAGRTFARALH
jgi:hypothetical protein